MKKVLTISLGALLIILLMSVTTPYAKDKTIPPGVAITGGKFWAGGAFGMSYSWIATYPIHYEKEKVGGDGEAGNTYGPNIRNFSIDGSEASEIILQGTVHLKNFGVWEATSYFEIGIGGSLNSWHQAWCGCPPYWYPVDDNWDNGTVYVIFLGNADGGYDIHIQDYVTHRPAESAVYRTTGTPGQDPVPSTTFHFEARFDLDNKLAYLTIDGVSVDPVPFGKAFYWSGDENFDTEIGVFAGILSQDDDNIGSARMSALGVTVK